LTLLVGSFDPQKLVPEMTYNVFSGTLNPTHSLTPHIIARPPKAENVATPLSRSVFWCNNNNITRTRVRCTKSARHTATQPHIIHDKLSAAPVATSL